MSSKVRPAPDATHAAVVAVASSAHDVLAGLLDAVIEVAPELVRQNHLIAAADWRLATAAQISRLVERFEQHGKSMPTWLVRDILLAGHALPAERTNLPPELHLLNQLNANDTQPGAALVAEVRDAARHGALSTGVVGKMADRLIASGNQALACEMVLAQWPATAQALRQVRQYLPDYVDALPRLKVRVTGFSTIATFTQALLPAFAARGVHIEASEAAFATVIAELLSPRLDADALFVVLDAMTLIEEEWRDGIDAHASLFEARLASLIDAIGRYARSGGKSLLINSLAADAGPALGHIDAAHPAGRANLIRRANAALAEAAQLHDNIQLIDADNALSQIAPDQRIDRRMWFYGRMAHSDAAIRALASAYATAWAGRTAKPVKVIALDFDNTLWGGVFGDDGIDKLACGDDAPGNAFKAFQAECLRLKAQGNLLVGVSKNNADAIDVFEKHPGMLLKASDFAATAIDWQPKPDNIRRLAADLNLGVDSFLFIDDSPHERQAMRRMCPDVRVPEMPADPALRPSWLRTLTATWPLRLTSEDAERSQMYAAERQARTLKDSAASYDDYLRELEQKLVVAPLNSTTLPRIAQLHERTNQFNLTTRRFTQTELSAFMADPEHAVVLTGTASDRFGNHGIVIAAVTRVDGATAQIDSLLMSCRVIARQVETAFLGALLEHLKERGIATVIGRFMPTAKNGMVKDFFSAHGFQPAAGDGQTSTTWTWQMGQDPLPASAFVAVEWSTT